MPGRSLCAFLVSASAFTLWLPARAQEPVFPRQKMTGQKLEAPAPPRSEVIDLGPYQIQPEEKQPRFKSTQGMASALLGRLTGAEPPPDVRPRGDRYYVVGVPLAGLATAQDQIAALGGEVIDSVPNAFIVRMDGAAAERVESLRARDAVDFLDLYEPKYKIPEYLREQIRRVERGEPLWRAPEREVLPEPPGMQPAADPAAEPPEVLDRDEAGPPHVDVTIYLFPDAAQEPVQSLIEERGGKVLGQGQRGGINMIRARVPTPVVEELAARVEVRSIQPYAPATLRNDQAARIIHARPPELDVELTGAGQVIGHADSGLDRGQADGTLHPDFQGRVRAAFALGRPPDDWSDHDGHGTHTAGSILGSGVASPRGFRGMAPQAELVHQSLGDAFGGLGGIPDPIGDLLQQAFDAGARIHSDSWGVSVTRRPDLGGVYLRGEEVDDWIWNQGQPKEMLVVVAVGNDGRVGAGSVGSPATAKNCLAVGATENLRPAVDPGGDDPKQLADFSSLGPTRDGRIRPDVVAPGTWVVSSRTQAEVVVWENDAEAAQGWTADAPFALAQGQALSGASSWRYVQPAGATFRHFAHSQPLAIPLEPVSLEVWVRGRVAPERALALVARRSAADPWIALARLGDFDFGDWHLVSAPLVDAMFGQPGVQVGVAMLNGATNAGPVDVRLDDFRITTFASWGSLSSSGLAVPKDAVDRQYTLMGGTSMATPVAAGAAALVRESFVRAGTQPSAELLKAVLINGADALGAPRPNNSSGWGRIDLARSLETPQIFDFESSLETGQSIRYAFRVTRAQPELRITLVWADPPGERLQHDLDLVLSDPQGGSRFPAGASAAAPDTRNNVEGIDVPAPALGEWRLEVAARQVAAGPQPFAVVISGAVEAIPQ